MTDPIAYFLTWNTYGTWLPGDERGWVEYHRGWKLPDPIRELECAARMTEDACRLSSEERAAVELQITETCLQRAWYLHAVNCRTNHIHVVVSAIETAPQKVRRDLKSWTTRCLKQFDRTRQHWWAERGSIRHIFDEAALESVVLYTIDAQDRKASTIRRIDRRTSAS